MILKKRSSFSQGFTLVELLITIAILAIISVPVGSALITTFQSFAIDKQIQEDQFNVRVALLAMTRDLHNLDADDVDDTRLVINGGIIGEGIDELLFSKNDVRFSYKIVTVNSQKMLQRFNEDTGLKTTFEETGVPFAEVPINELDIELEKINEVIRYIKIDLTCGNPGNPDRTTVSTKISISRIPPL